MKNERSFLILRSSFFILHSEISVVSPCAIFTSVPWLTVHAVLCVTASTSPAADGWPLPLFLTPPKGKCTSAPMHGTEVKMAQGLTTDIEGGPA